MCNEESSQKTNTYISCNFIREILKLQDIMYIILVHIRIYFYRADLLFDTLFMIYKVNMRIDENGYFFKDISLLL